MAVDEDDAPFQLVRRSLVGALDAAFVIRHFELQRPTHHPASGIDVGDRHLGTAAQLLAKGLRDRRSSARPHR